MKRVTDTGLTFRKALWEWRKSSEYVVICYKFQHRCTKVSSISTPRDLNVEFPTRLGLIMMRVYIHIAHISYHTKTLTLFTNSLKTSMLLKRTTNSKILCPSNMHRNCKHFSTLAIEEVAITAVRCPWIKPKNNQNHPNVQSFFLFECQIPYKARVGYEWVYIHKMALASITPKPTLQSPTRSDTSPLFLETKPNSNLLHTF